MQRKLKIEGLNCPHCAQKLEKELNKIKGINKIMINFLASKIIIDANNDIINEVVDDVKKKTSNIDKKIKFI